MTAMGDPSWEAELPQFASLTESMYNNPDQSTRAAAEMRLKQEYSSQGRFLAFALSRLSNDYAVMYCALALVPWFRSSMANMDSNERSSIIQIVYTAAHGLHNNQQGSRQGFSAVLSCLSRLTKLTYEKEDTAVKVAVTEALTILQRQPSAQDVNFALLVLRSLITEIGVHNSSKADTFLSFAAHRRCSNNFRDSSLLAIFVAAMDQLERVTQGHPNSLATVEVVKGCMTYDFLAIFVDETEDAMSTQFPTSWKDVLLSPRIQEILWGQHQAMSMPHCLHLLQGIAGLCGTRRGFFDTTEEKESFLNSTICKLIDIANAQDGRMSEVEYCGVLIECCFRFITPYGYKDLHALPAFASWLRFMEWLTEQMISRQFVEESSFSATLTALRFWSRMGSSKRMMVDEINTEDLEPLQMQVAFQFFVNRVSTSTQVGDGSSETIMNQTDLIWPLVVVRPQEILPMMTNHMKGTAPQLLNPGNDGFVSGVGGLTWFFYIGSSVTRNLNAEEENVMAYSNFLSLLVEGVSQVRSHWTQIRVEYQDYLEAALLSFLSSLSYSFSANGRQSTHTTSIMTNVFGNKAELFQFYISSVGHNFVRPLKQVDGGCDEREYAIVQQSVNLIKDLCSEMPSSILSLMSLDIPPVVQLPIASSKATYKLRTNLYAALWAIRVPHESYSREALYNFLNPVEALISSTVSGKDTDPLFIAGWLRDLRGVSRGTCNYSTCFSDFVEWVLERSDTFLTLSSQRNPPLITISLLRFICELVTPCHRYGKVNVPVASHSATGVLLFQFISKVLRNVLTNSINNEMVQQVVSGQLSSANGVYEHMMKPILLAMETMRRCVVGDFVPFGAMALYRDDSYETTVSGMLRLLAVFPLDLFSQYRKVTNAAMDLLKSMTELSVYSPLAHMEATDFLTLINFAISMASDPFLETPCLINTLTFLSFIACLVKLVKKLMTEGADNSTPGAVTTHTPRHYKHTMANALIPHPDLWERLIGVAMNIIVCQDRALSVSSQIVFPIFEVDSMFWTTFSTRFVASYPQEKQASVSDIIGELGLSANTYENFFNAIFSFRSAIRKL